jgi:hypothetical protein
MGSKVDCVPTLAKRRLVRPDSEEEIAQLASFYGIERLVRLGGGW